VIIEIYNITYTKGDTWQIVPVSPCLFLAREGGII